MKYFNNITTKEELKKQFRNYCVTMHPDKGGNADEFKAMVAEYNNINANFERAKEQAREEEEARKRAEEARKEEEERKRKEEEEERKAAEALREVIAKWSGVLKNVAGLDDGTRYGHSAAYFAAVKYNIKAIFSAYFPGVQVKVSFKNSGYHTSANISWVDGPTIDQVAEVEEFGLFCGWHHVYSDYEDYGHNERTKAHEPWIKEFGEIGRTQRFNYDRTFSKLGEAEVLSKIYEIFPQFDGMTKRTDAASISSDDVYKLEKFFGFWYDLKGKTWQDLSDKEREEMYEYESEYMDQRQECDKLESENYYGNTTELRQVLKVFAAYYTVSEETTKASAEAAAAPVFEPKHGKTWQAIKKALGSNVFGVAVDDRYHYKGITINEAAEMLAKGEKIYLVKPHTFDGEPCFYGVNLGGAKVQQKRAEKFAAVGIQIYCSGYNSYKDVEVLQFAPNVIAELRKDAEEVEKQRKAWEEEQKNNKTQKSSRKQSGKTAAAQDAQAATDTTDEAPAEGLELIETAEGVAVVGDQRTTYRNRKAIKAHGARWNKDAQQWQATDPEAVASLREWFGVADNATTKKQDKKQAEEVSEYEKALCIFVACIVGRDMVECDKPGITWYQHYIGSTSDVEDWEDLQSVCPDALKIWAKFGRPVTRLLCVDLFGEDFVKSTEVFVNIAQNSKLTDYGNDWAATWHKVISSYNEENGTTEEQPTQEQPAEEQPTAQATPLHDADEITETDRANLSALSGLAFALQSITSSLLSAFDDWKADDVAARVLRKNIADSLEEIKKLNERLRDYSERLEAIEKRQAARADGTAAADEQATQSTQATAQDANEQATDEQATDSAQNGGKVDRLEMLRAAAEDVQRLTDDNEHGRATLAELYTLCACGVEVRDLIDEVKELNTAETLGREIAPNIWAKRSEVRRSARNRAKVALSNEEFATLYSSGSTSSTSPKAA